MSARLHRSQNAAAWGADIDARAAERQRVAEQATTEYTVTTAGGAQVEVSTCPDNTIIVCLSGCRTCLTFWAHLSDNHAAEAKGYANGHAGACSATPIGGVR